MIGHGGEIVRDAKDGDFTVTVNSPEVLAALDQFINLMKTCARPITGRSDRPHDPAHGQRQGCGGSGGIAAWANFEKDEVRRGGQGWPQLPCHRPCPARSPAS